MAAEYARCWLTIVSFSAMYALFPWLAAKLGAGLPAGLLGGLLGSVNPVHLSGISGKLGEELAATALGVAMVHTWLAGNTY
jgi:hypothetical protein